MTSYSGISTTGSVSDVGEANKEAKKLYKRKFLSSSVHIWKSKISWRITLSAFMTILLVQTCILNFSSMHRFETQKLDELRESGHSFIVPLVNLKKVDMYTSPLEEMSLGRLFLLTRLRGVTVYGSGLTDDSLVLIKSYGEMPVTTLFDQNNVRKTYRSADYGRYEFVSTVPSPSGTFYMVVRMDSSHVQGQLFDFVMQTILIMLLMSAFVTTVLMIALGHWLLEPILFIRSSLQEAARNPEDPDLPESPFDPNDEIGGAIDIAHNLIRQNAVNLKHIKSAAEDKIHKLAYYDTLTGLPNRILFLQSLAERAREGGEAKASRFAVVALDLDHFKDINDSMGHNIGDAILRGVGRRLRAAMPETAVVSRSGEDEYFIMMPLSGDVVSARDVAERVMDVVRAEPFMVFNESFQVRASVGVSTFPDDGTDPDQVLKNADIALNRAKEEGRDIIKEYSEDFDRAVQQRFQMLRDLRDAMEHDQLELFYQPQFDLKSGALIGAEALLRWWKPDNSKEGGSFISPGVFIPVAEQSGLIVPIGQWVMREACEMVKSWKDEHGVDIRIAVNVSASQFIQSDICGFTQQLLDEVGLPAHKLELEVTESVFMDDIQHTIQTLQNLHAIGVELAIDDFGTGYSSLSYLRQFPIDRLKIDQSFIRNALNDQDDASIARTIIALGRALGLKVIAEGVESIEHEKFLTKEGCDEVQGFRYSRPVPAGDFIEFAKNYNGKLSSFSS